MRFAHLVTAGLVALSALTGSGLAWIAAQDKPPELVATTEARTPEDERASFHLPPGFEIQLVAAEPDIHKPMNIAFDDKGRLWVTETIEYPFPAKEGVTPRDGVKILADFDETGRARTITTFADGLNIPIGLLPLPDSKSALVHNIPEILKLTDTDGDGKADRREVLYSTFGARDTHGMTNSFSWGPDGWIYATHGFSNESKVAGADEKPIVMQSGNTYRMKADGSHLEYFTHGQVNPFGLCFDPLGNLYSADCHTRPMYQLLRGAWYPSFGKPHDGLGFGPEMVTHDHGSTAIAGIVYYAAPQFPAPYRDALYVGNVVTNRINFDTLERHGSTYNGIAQPDFLRSDDPWFRPVDLKLGPDGALYVADFYNRIIGHYEVPLDHPGRDRERGRIWRIVYKGDDAKTENSPAIADFATAPAGTLIAALNDPNIVVRTKATNQLVERGKPEDFQRLEQDAGTNGPLALRHKLWILERAGVLKDTNRLSLESAAKHDDPGVRVHVQRILAERGALSDADRGLVTQALKDGDAFVRRAAADALGRHPAPANVPPLLALRHDSPEDDTHLVHAVRMSLRDQFLDGKAFDAFAVADLSEADARAIADVATGVPSARSAAFLLAHVGRWAEPLDELQRYVRHIARYGEGESANEVVAFARESRPSDLPHQLALLKAIREGVQERGQPFGDSLKQWALDRCRPALAGAEPRVVVAGLGEVRAFRLASLGPDISGIVAARGREEPVRVSAFEAIAALLPEDAVRDLGVVLADAAESVVLRDQAAIILTRLNRPDARPLLLAALPTAPARLQASIAAGLAGQKDGAEALLEAVQAGKASARLLTERSVEVRLRESKIEGLDERLAALTQGLPPAGTETQLRIDRGRESFARVDGKRDPARGAELFEKHCAACHTLGGKGGKVGPQLDGVGLRGADRLFEDILDPNRNVDQAFRSTSLALKDGQVLSGLLLRQEGQILILADAQGREQRIDKDHVDESQTTPLSPMPANLGDQLTEREMNDLLAYLLAQKPADGRDPR